MISQKVATQLKSSSAIRAMFEEGVKLKQQYGADNVFDFSLGNPDPEPPETAKQALKRFVLEDKPGAHGYMPNAGYADVRQKIAESLNKSSGASLTAAHVVMTVGAGGGLNITLKALLDPGDEVIVLAPYFMEYGFYIDNHGGKIVVVPTLPETFQPDIAAIEKSITPRTKAVIINSPHNPTGVIYGEAALREMSDLLAAKEAEYGNVIYLISDEPYREIVYDGAELPNIFNLFNNVIAVYSFSKSLSLPGERIGYVAVNDKCSDAALLADALIFANRTLGFVNAPALFQKVVGESLGTAVNVSIYEERRDMLYNHLISLGFSCVKPQGAFYLFPKSPIADVQELKSLALKHKIILVPGSGFGCDTHFRLAYCTSLKTIERSLPAFTALARELGL